MAILWVLSSGRELHGRAPLACFGSDATSACQIDELIDLCKDARVG